VCAARASPHGLPSGQGRNATTSRDVAALCITAKFAVKCLSWVNCTHYRAAALLSASPQLAESIHSAERFRVVPILLQKSLPVSVRGDSVALMRFATEAGDDGATQSRSKTCCRCISCCEISSQQLHLYLSWADAVSHDCTAHAQRFLHSLSRISRSLVLHLGVELGSDQDHDDRKPDPDHEADSGT